MAPGRFRLSWVLAATLAVYLLTLVVMLRWHWALGPPHTQASLSLMISFGLCAALLGLSSILVALAALHWTRRASGLVAGVAVMGLFFQPFFDWDDFLIWQLLVMFGMQTGCLVVALLAARGLGCGLGFLDAGERWKEKPRLNRGAAVLDIRHPYPHRCGGFAFCGATRLATNHSDAARPGNQHCRRVWRGDRRVDGPLGVLRMVACHSQGGGAHPGRSDGRSRLHHGRSVLRALVQLAVVCRCHVDAGLVHDDSLLHAAGSWVSVLAAESGVERRWRTMKTANRAAPPFELLFTWETSCRTSEFRSEIDLKELPEPHPNHSGSHSPRRLHRVHWRSRPFGFLAFQHHSLPRALVPMRQVSL